MVDYLSHAAHREIGKLHLDNGTHPLDRGAYRDADDGILAQRSVEHPSRKFFGVILGGLEGATERANVLTLHKNARIVG